MSKQHHFTVWFDTATEKWDIGYANYEEDRPLYLTDEEGWTTLDKEDARRDDKLTDELRARLESPMPTGPCGQVGMAGGACDRPIGHDGSHNYG